MTYIIDHIPKSTPKNRRPGLVMIPTTITIHNTGNPSSTARNERNWLTNPSNGVTASYHIVIDERETIECLPLNEVGWHAGDGGNGPGNRKSIGIEICESGNYDKTLDRAATLVADILRVRGWGTDRLRRHYDWSGKNCPRKMNADGKWTGWAEFKAAVEAKLKPKPEPVKSRTASLVDVNVIVNGEKLTGAEAGFITGGLTYLPARAIAERLGASVTWDDATRTVNITR
ncbi:N-acetylmuramoyl-L-alanine amidase [Paenibacillus sp. CAU 1782]